METFTLDIVFKSQEFNVDKNDFELKPVKKTATFKELSESDPDQRELTFTIWSLWEGVKSVGKKTKIIVANPSILSSITDEIVDVLLLVNDGKTVTNSLTPAEKTQLKNDNVAMARLGKWFAEEKLSFFFLQQEMSYGALLKPQKSTSES